MKCDVVTVRETLAGNPVLAAIATREARILNAMPRGKSGAAFLEIFCARDRGLTHAVREDAFLFALQLQASEDFDLFADGRFIQKQRFDSGAVAIFDLRTNLAADIRDPFHAIDFYLPRDILDAVTDDAGLPRIDELRHHSGTAEQDPVARALLWSMQPALAGRPEEVSALFVDHVATAMTVHIAQRYGGVRLLRPTPRGGLAPWQDRRAKDLLCANLNGSISLTDIAGACDLSVRHFTRAFRQSTGMSANEWLVKQRIEKVKNLLADSAIRLADIAASCGFADQSHLTRSFCRATGMLPTQWRRLHRGPNT